MKKTLILQSGPLSQLLKQFNSIPKEVSIFLPGNMDVEQSKFSKEELGHINAAYVGGRLAYADTDGNYNAWSDLDKFLKRNGFPTVDWRTVLDDEGLELYYNRRKYEKAYVRYSLLDHPDWQDISLVLVREQLQFD